MKLTAENENLVNDIINGTTSDKAEIETNLTDAAKKKLAERIQGMSQEELEIVADTIPIELCLNRIEKELSRAKDFENLVKKAIGSLR